MRLIDELRRADAAGRIPYVCSRISLPAEVVDTWRKLSIAV